MAKFVKYQNGGIPDDLKKKFESAGYESNKDGTKFTKGQRVFKLNKDGTYDFISKNQRKQNLKGVAVKTLRGILDTGTLGISNLLRYNPKDADAYGDRFGISPAKKSDIPASKVEGILTKQEEKDAKVAELRKQREEKQEQKKQQVLANREKRLADKEAEKKALLERKQQVREDYIAQQNAEEAARLKAREEEARKKAEAEALRQKQAQEDELKRQQEAERLAPFADDIANFNRTPKGEVAHIDALPDDIRAKYMEQIQAELKRRQEGAIQMLSPEDFLTKTTLPGGVPMSKDKSASFADFRKNYGIDVNNWRPGQIVVAPDGSTKVLVDIRQGEGKISPNQKKSKTYLAFMDFETQETKEQTFNQAYRDAVKGGLKPGDTFKFKGKDILIEDDPDQTPEEAKRGERKEVTTETKKLSEEINKARLNKTGRKGMIARFKKVNG
tara:strand:+ start:2702 stop:4030 length:1329 start_codon:yes stop_codon:yes gene_type:complete